MRWLGLVLFCMVILATCAEPEPKKYKPETKPKDKPSNTSLTSDEKKFLREVESKFGIKSDIPLEENNEDDNEEDSKETETAKTKPPFPAVIAIEIVNDTDTKSKGKKRTIDANLGYGYRTNNGYTYTYFGKPAQERGKFMIYPYSQEDIPAPSQQNSGYSHQTVHTKTSTEVEITPSQAFELVPAKEEQTGYHYEKPAINYEHVQSVQSPPPVYPTTESSHHALPPSTLYTTYNGQQFSSLSGQFPSVMSNYLVDPTQLLKHPQYQSAGLTQDHLRTHGAQLEQRVVPVLVLRIPSSYLKNPSAELYANVPQNYPLSQHLNNVNLQNLVNDYFKKIGFSHAPQVMTYQNAPTPVESASAAISSHQPQQYASPYVQPSYTHADYSGVQYSAVQPVMAKYPSGYTRPQYYITRGQSLYSQPVQQQQYVYQYRYLPQSAVSSQNYYVQPKYQQQQVSYQLAPQQEQTEHVTLDQQPNVHDASGHTEYAVQQLAGGEDARLASVEVSTPEPDHAQTYEQVSVSPNYSPVSTATPHYEVSQEHTYQTSVPTEQDTNLHVPTYTTHLSQVTYEQPAQKESVTVYSRGQTGHRYAIPPQTGVEQNFVYQTQGDHHSDNSGLVLTENYPSKDHTIATVLPLRYKSREPAAEHVQAVSYVTPVPQMKYQSQYRVMVPQTILRRPTQEKVSYVNSHSYPASYGGANTSSRDHNSEEEHTVGRHYVPPIGRQKPPSYPRNYHSHPKRMARPDHKLDNVLKSRKQHERNNKKRSP